MWLAVAGLRSIPSSYSSWLLLLAVISAAAAAASGS